MIIVYYSCFQILGLCYIFKGFISNSYIIYLSHEVIERDYFYNYREQWRKCRSGHNTGHWAHGNAAVGHASVNRIRESDDISRKSSGVHTN